VARRLLGVNDECDSSPTVPRYPLRSNPGVVLVSPLHTPHRRHNRQGFSSPSHSDTRRVIRAFCWTHSRDEVEHQRPVHLKYLNMGGPVVWFWECNKRGQWSRGRRMGVRCRSSQGSCATNRLLMPASHA
jgi:hypothetical protein